MGDADRPDGSASCEDSCRETVHRLYHFLDGELTEDRRAAIRRHLDECRPCLNAFDFEAELRHVIARRCQDRVPESLRERVARAIQHEAGKSAKPADRTRQTGRSGEPG